MWTRLSIQLMQFDTNKNKNWKVFGVYVLGNDREVLLCKQLSLLRDSIWFVEKNCDNNNDDDYNDNDSCLSFNI